MDNMKPLLDAVTADINATTVTGNINKATATGDINKSTAMGAINKATAMGDINKATATGDINKATAMGVINKATATGDINKATATGDKAGRQKCCDATKGGQRESSCGRRGPDGPPWWASMGWSCGPTKVWVFWDWLSPKKIDPPHPRGV